jgi:Na+-transporting NADH:ubiquinone oxidoreductase subunit C
MAEESVIRSYYTVLILAFVCSALVAGTAVGLRPKQEANRLQDQRKNILYAAGLYEEDKSVDELFAPIETRFVELATGQYVAETPGEQGSSNRARSTQSETRILMGDEDLAGLHLIDKYSPVYLVKQNGLLRQIVLPVRGKGLWSTMYAYVAIDSDLTTIRGVSFYEHGETPGLGGEIENQKWQDSWQGKKLFTPGGEMKLRVVKGKADVSGGQSLYQIDGISGATLTIKGVSNLMEFWFGEHGFKPYFSQLKKNDQLKNKDNSSG